MRHFFPAFEEVRWCGAQEWEASLGFLRAWTAHIYHQKTAAAPFKEARQGSIPWTPTPMMRDPSAYPISIEVPKGLVTEAGTRRNLRMLVEYLEGWLRGRGAKGIDSLPNRCAARHDVWRHDRIQLIKTVSKILWKTQFLVSLDVAGLIYAERGFVRMPALHLGKLLLVVHMLIRWKA